MKKNLFAIVIFLAAMAIAADSAAQGMGPQRMGGWGRQGSYHRLYNPDTVKTISGEVVRVEYFVPQEGMGQGVHVQLKTLRETLPVHLGPRWFLDNQDVQIEKGDRIQAKGSQITFENKPAVIAAEIEKGDDILRLRDNNGFPRWAGWRRRGR